MNSNDDASELAEVTIQAVLDQEHKQRQRCELFSKEKISQASYFGICEYAYSTIAFLAIIIGNGRYSKALFD